MRSEENKGRVMDYIHRLDNFNGDAVAKIAKDDEYKMYEEAFEIYKKFSNLTALPSVCSASIW